jgi:hypothetical protein
MPRAQFTLKTMLWVMAVVACAACLVVGTGFHKEQLRRQERAKMDEWARRAAAQKLIDEKKHQQIIVDDRVFVSDPSGTNRP